MSGAIFGYTQPSKACDITKWEVLRMQAIAYVTKYGWIYYFDVLELVVVYHLSEIS